MVATEMAPAVLEHPGARPTPMEGADMADRTCAVCGEAFAPRANGGKPQLYCSLTCRAASKRGKYKTPAPKQKACLSCGAVFATYRAKLYCSPECRASDAKCCRCGCSVAHLPNTSKNRYCRSCDAVLARRRRQADPSISAVEVAYQRLRKYGLTAADYERMHDAQGGVCAICGEPERAARNGRPKTLAVDHDHVTGEVRGLLCQRCNTALGSFGDSLEGILRVVRYLEGR